ncbi:hypothetical protein P5Y53_13665 [Dyella jiangningensis]|uniref:hypothetical protein n=1 Tax=Dyella jiangningensis TaxID=1379159 RepID=UPI00240FDC58|nr:hypothetical protein [Dyella jiangningensis]MDG2538717.1 hypothetical protein [Dyella jiangningensis]
MSIFYERRQWEPGEAYYFRSTFDFQDICVVAKQGDLWELRFYRGSSNTGPFLYKDFAKAKRQVFRYLAPREICITGGPRRVAICGGNDTCPPAGLRTVHPSRKPKRRNWVTEG